MERLCHALRKLLPTIGNSNKMFHVSALPRDLRLAEPPPRHSCHLTTSWRSRYKHFTRISWKRKRNCARKYVLHNTWRNWGLNPIVSKLPLPNIQTNALRYTEATWAHFPPHHWLAWSGRLDLWCRYSFLNLWLEPLAPSGVQMKATAFFGPVFPSRPLVLPCLAPHWFSHALWSCPAWHRTGPPTPSGPVLPGAAPVFPRPLVLSCLVLHWSSHTPSGPVLPGSAPVLLRFRSSPIPVALPRSSSNY